MNKIYIYVNGSRPNGDLMGVALAEDGELLLIHYSSNLFYLNYDMGVNSLINHHLYKQKYPDGYSVEFVNDPFRSLELHEVLRKNKAFYEQKTA